MKGRSDARVVRSSVPTPKTRWTTAKATRNFQNLGLFQNGTYARIVHQKSRRVRMKRSEEHTSELQSHSDLVCRLLLEKKKKKKHYGTNRCNSTTTLRIS